MVDDGLEDELLQLSSGPMHKGLVHGHIHNYNNLTYIHGHIHKNDLEDHTLDEAAAPLNCSQYQDCAHFEFVNCHSLNLFGKNNGPEDHNMGKLGTPVESPGLKQVECEKVHCQPRFVEVCCDEKHDKEPNSFATGLDFLDCHLTCDSSAEDERSDNECAATMQLAKLKPYERSPMIRDNIVPVPKKYSMRTIENRNIQTKNDQVAVKTEPNCEEDSGNTSDDQLFDHFCSQCVDYESLDSPRIHHNSHSHVLNSPNDIKVLKDLSIISNFYDLLGKHEHTNDNSSHLQHDHDSMNLLHSTLNGYDGHPHHAQNHHHHQVQLHTHPIIPDTNINSSSNSTSNIINFNWSFCTNNEPIQCQWEECIQSYDNLLDLQSHLMKDHVSFDDNKSADCKWSDCDFNTDDVCSMVNHVNGKHGICFDVKLLDKDTLTKQVNEHKFLHEESQEHICQWGGCNQTFDNSKCLNEHIESNHIPSGLSTYKCEWDGCQKKFVQRQKLAYTPFKGPF